MTPAQIKILISILLGLITLYNFFTFASKSHVQWWVKLILILLITFVPFSLLWDAYTTFQKVNNPFPNSAQLVLKHATTSLLVYTIVVCILSFVLRVVVYRKPSK